MKKFISLLIASAMVVSLVPATAFAGSDVSATAKIVGKQTIVEEGSFDADNSPELQIKIADAAYSGSDSTGAEMEIVLTVDNVSFCDEDAVDGAYSGALSFSGGTSIETLTAESYTAVMTDEDELTITIAKVLFEDDDVIKIPLIVDYSGLEAGDDATVSVESDMVEADDLVFIVCADTGIEASVDDIVYVAEDEGVTLEDLVIEESVSGTFAVADEVGDDGDDDYVAAVDQILVLELSKGFEFGDKTEGGSGYDSISYSDEFAYVFLNDEATSDGEVEITGLYIYADGADEGDVATIEITLYNGSSKSDVKSKNKVAECEVEVAEVCEYTVTISVDEDEDVPVMYSGVDSDNEGLNDDSDHVSLEITIKESFPGAWNYRDEFELTLPEGVYVVEDGVKSEDENIADWVLEDAFAQAYVDGDYEGFEFGKRSFADNVEGDEAYELVFTLTLVAEPDFEGEVELGFILGDDEIGEVVIAEFVAPFTVEASQNDVIIDYRNTPINTPVVLTEAEAELWAEGLEFYFTLDSYMSFDDEGEVSVDSDSGMEVDVDNGDDYIEIAIDTESDDEAAVLTWEGIELYMSRSLAAGAYGLSVSTSASKAFMAEKIFANDLEDDDVVYIGDVVDGTDYVVSYVYDDDEVTITAIKGYITEGYEVCENFVNIVTAGSDQATTFTTKVIVPIGEYYIYSGGTQIELDVPAYISADGYTMLPVRAVATAIGVATSNVLWDSATQQVTIIYGTKTIAMVIGQQYMTVNGTAIPTSACPEIVDGRTFLPLRDLATALSVTDISWDADTRTASLN